uniref:Flagellar assembly factor FliW n=1 Tax=Globodera pallida TaxID=36090 RepID=A0A183C273_GLOPA
MNGTSSLPLLLEVTTTRKSVLVSHRVDLIVPLQDAAQFMFHFVRGPFAVPFFHLKDFAEYELRQPFLDFHLEGDCVAVVVLLCHLDADAFDVVDEGAQVRTEIALPAHHRQLAQRIMKRASHVLRVPVVFAKEVEGRSIGGVRDREGTDQ